MWLYCGHIDSLIILDSAVICTGSSDFFANGGIKMGINQYISTRRFYPIFISQVIFTPIIYSQIDILNITRFTVIN